jgi:hypothetical protein
MYSWATSCFFRIIGIKKAAKKIVLETDYLITIWKEFDRVTFLVHSDIDDSYTNHELKGELI